MNIPQTKEDIYKLSPEDVKILRKKFMSDFFAFCVGVMGYNDLDPEVHGEFCYFLESPGDRKLACMPRSFVKTWISTIAYSIWVTLPRKEEDEFPYPKAWEDRYWQLGPNMRILIASYVISNAAKMVHLIRRTYESNTMMQVCFPEVLPDFNHVKWSNESACIQRSENFTESTFETAGIGGASISRHYDLIIEDDLVYAKKDDLGGGELQPDRDDIEKAIGWHKLSTSLLVPGTHTHIHVTGTRWCKDDLVDFVVKTEPSYKSFQRRCVKGEDITDWESCTPMWPKMYPIEQLKKIRDAQGPYIFSTQYLLNPISHEEALFKKHYLQYYTSTEELPEEMKTYTTIDLAEWGNTVRKGHNCDAVVLTCSWDSKGHCWIRHYDKGRFDPSEIIELMGKHWSIFSPEFIAVEAVYYQKAVAHFARKAMEEGKIPFLNIRQVKPEGNVSKDVRIRAIEPLASNLGIHCRQDHHDFIEEFASYVPSSKLSKKDLLDALAYQIQVARPFPSRREERTKPKGEMVFETNMDEVLADLLKQKPKEGDVLSNPFVQEEGDIDKFDLDPHFLQEDEGYKEE